MQDPERILRQNAAYNSPSNSVSGPSLEALRMQEVTALLDTGTRKRVQDIGAFSLKIVNTLQSRGVQPNVAVDSVQFEDRRFRGKVEIARKFIGRGWILDESPEEWAPQFEDNSNAVDYYGPKIIPAHWKPVRGSCLLEDGTIGTYVGYPPKDSGKSSQYPRSRHPGDNPYGRIAEDFSTGNLWGMEIGYGLVHADLTPQFEDEQQEKEYKAAILQVCGVESSFDTSVGLVSDNHIRNFQLAGGWRNKLQVFVAVV